MRLPTLHQFFRHQLEQGFQARGLGKSEAVDYVSDVLTRFAQTRALYSLRDDEGRPLEHIVDMLTACQQAQEAGSRAAVESSIVRHIGDYTLFMTGLFRERVEARGELDYYTAHGRTAFWRSADFEINPNRRRLYRQLYQDFEPISDILDYLRRVQFPLQARSENLLAAFWRA
ncbi:hypothetical protein SVA_0511 [Sulfurifustis variabilis]|uniref:Uncharacterized protein n=1 Tax=Sulfurifustis variabilis TaxID=1675686 RepID=A0A1B4V3L5_9GAMM|nr:hypothetical protein [Sulfurifustis variabilis]BAU47092.1 hypothetical protein SVA_0511 [Sulfurifustis variabilis]